MIGCETELKQMCKIKRMNILKYKVLGAVLIAGFVVVINSVIADEGGGHYQLTGDVVPLNDAGIYESDNASVTTLQSPVEALRDFPRE